MKKISTIIAIFLTTISAFAEPMESSRKVRSYQGKLSISTITNEPFRILIDGNAVNNKIIDGDCLINDISAGYHSIKIYRQKKYGYNNDSWRNKNMQVIYAGNIYIKPQYHVDIIINRFGKAFIDEKQMNEDYNNDKDDYGWDNNNNNQQMNNSSFEQFKNIISKENFDNTRLTIAKQTINDNYFSTAQVKEIIQLFSFESNKLDIAKYSYKNTIDQNNYFLLNDAFVYSSSKEELSKFIQGNR